MAKILYIQSSPRKDRSKSSQVAAAFLESYKQANPDDLIQTLNVFEENLPAFDGLAVQAKYTIMHGKDHTPEERLSWYTIEKLIAQFKDADKYVLSLPMWNFGIPYRLKQYFDLLVQPGYTFTVNENGYEGLVKGKPMIVVYARGGAYAEGSQMEAFDLQKKYIELILAFMGFNDIQSIIVEPTLQGGPQAAQKALDESIAKAGLVAANF
jgi:FMN-dependent NADH-azoreductase